MNEWSFSGKIVYEKDINNTFQSVKLRGSFQRDGGDTVLPTEIPVFIPKELWNELTSNGVRIYDFVTLKGHFEVWVKTSHGYNQAEKLVHIADKVLEYVLE